MDILLTVLAILGTALFIFCMVAFVIDTNNHIKYLNKQEKYWDDKKKEREKLDKHNE
jgi:hypothetical protein